MNKKIGLAMMAVLISFALWKATQKKNDATRAAASGSPETSASGLVQASAEFTKVLQSSEQLLRQGDFMGSALKLYQEFPSFEMTLNGEGYKELKAGVTLRDWFTTEQARFTSVIESEFPRLLDAAQSGDSSWRDLEAFLNQMPFPFINEIQRRYKSEQRQALAQGRASLATHWCLISVSAVSGGGAEYERIVRDALRKKWTAPPGWKLVFDSPMSQEERRAAPKVISVRIEEKLAEYQFEGKAAQRGSGQVAEQAIVKFSDDTLRKGGPRSNWDALHVRVTNSAPDVLRFKFANERQTADFSDVAEAQRRALEKHLAAAIANIPVFQIQ